MGVGPTAGSDAVAACGVAGPAGGLADPGREPTAASGPDGLPVAVSTPVWNQGGMSTTATTAIPPAIPAMAAWEAWLRRAWRRASADAARAP